MGIPSTKTVTLAWDGLNWHDQETGILVTGVAPLVADQVETKHPFEKSFNVTYEQVQKMIADAVEQEREREYNSHYPYVTVDRVDDLITKAIDAHTYHSHYFINADDLAGDSGKLVKHSDVMRIVGNRDRLLLNRLEELEREIKKSWWKRW